LTFETDLTTVDLTTEITDRKIPPDEEMTTIEHKKITITNGLTRTMTIPITKGLTNIMTTTTNKGTTNRTGITTINGTTKIMTITTNHITDHNKATTIDTMTDDHHIKTDPVFIKGDKTRVHTITKTDK
jgi:hypothetical protein